MLAAALLVESVNVLSGAVLRRSFAVIGCSR